MYNINIILMIETCQVWSYFDFVMNLFFFLILPNHICRGVVISGIKYYVPN